MRGTVLLSWALVACWLGAGRIGPTLFAEWAQWLLIGTAALLLLAGLAIGRAVGTPRRLDTLGHLLPLLLLAVTQPRALGQDDLRGAKLFSPSQAGFLADSDGLEETGAPSPVGEGSHGTDSPWLDFQQPWLHVQVDRRPEPESEREPGVITLLDCWEQRLAGQRIMVIGRWLPSAQLAALVNDERVANMPDPAVLYRFLVTCCIADARPLAVALDRIPEDLAPDAWVKITASVIRPQASDPMPRLFIRAIEPIAEPKRPYLVMPLW